MKTLAHVTRYVKLASLQALVCLLGAGGLNALAADYAIRVFHAPGSFDTLPFGINNQGLITGLWYPLEFTEEDLLTEEHGFLYSVDGTLTTIDAPFPGVVYTLCYQANESGMVAAGLGTADGLSTSALYDSKRDAWSRLPDPDPAAVASQAVAINDRGQVFGLWLDNPWYLNCHGWVYEHGDYTSFDVPAASPDSYGTWPSSANSRGDLVGDYYDSEGGIQGFIRHGNDGTFETISVPGAIPGSTRAIGINDQGTVVGRFLGVDGFLHGYILSKGAYTVFDVPGADNTTLTAINNRGDLVGYGYSDYYEPSFAFVALRPVR